LNVKLIENILFKDGFWVVIDSICFQLYLIYSHSYSPTNQFIMKEITNEQKIAILQAALELIKSHNKYNLCETIRMLTENKTGLIYDSTEIRVIFNLNDYKPVDRVRMEEWWSLDAEGQQQRINVIELLIFKLKNL